MDNWILSSDEPSKSDLNKIKSVYILKLIFKNMKKNKFLKLMKIRKFKKD